MTPTPAFSQRSGSPATPTSIGADTFGPTPVVTDAGHARAFEETESWVWPLLKRVPITRVYDATPLDVLGLPVWSAVTPLALDLTVHAGKGNSHAAARLSAVMEAIERVCGESVPGSRVQHASHAKLAAHTDDVLVVDPEIFDLPYQTAYRSDNPISWVLGYDLLTEQHAYLPLDLVISPANEGICIGAETNGLAAGNTMTEATVHALYEVVERDAIAEEHFYAFNHDPGSSLRGTPKMIDVSTFPQDSKYWVECLRSQDLDIVVQDATNSIGIPVFAAHVVDVSFPGAEGEVLTFGGYGADLNPARAVLRAVTEAVQSHTGTVLGARDEIEGLGPANERAAMLLRRLDVLYPDSLLPFSAGPGSSHDLYQDLKEILSRLSSAGIEHCFVTDLTRDDLGVPVVRVLVPGLAPPYGYSARRPGLRLLRSIR